VLIGASWAESAVLYRMIYKIRSESRRCALQPSLCPQCHCLPTAVLPPPRLSLLWVRRPILTIHSMSLNSVPRPFFVLESAPTSDDEGDEVVKSEPVNPRIRKPPAKAVFATSRAVFKPAPPPIVPVVKSGTPKDPPIKHRRSSADSLASLLSEEESETPSTIRTSIPATSPLQAAFEALDSSLHLDTLAAQLTCALCGGLMRHPQCMLDCMHTCKSYLVCKVCVFRWMVEQSSINKCPTCRREVAAST